MLVNEKICRTCLGENFPSLLLLEMIHNEEILISIKDMLMECASIYVNPDDNLPKSICQKCFELLQLSYNFKVQCKKSEEILLSIVSEDKANLKTEQLIDNDESDSKLIASVVETKLGTDENNDTEFEPDLAAAAADDDNDDDDDEGSITGKKFSVKKETKTNRVKQERKPSSKAVKREKIQNIERKFPCMECKKAFKKQYNLTQHTRRRHPLKYKLYKEAKEIKLSDKKFACTDCKSSYAIRKSLNRHRREKHISDRYKCEVCNASFVQYGRYVVHKQKHGYHCPVCLDTFDDKASLENHSSTHSPDIKFCCKDCRQTFSRKRRLFVHINMKHANDSNKYLCTICGKPCYTPANLLRHTESHEGVRKFACKMCDKKYSVRQSLKHHINATHEPQPKHYVCKTCGRLFTSSKQLRTHAKLHIETRIKKHKCDYCDKRFDRKSDCRTHIRIHTGEKPYQCALCDKRFAQQCALKTHTRIHDNMKVY